MQDKKMLQEQLKSQQGYQNWRITFFLEQWCPQEYSGYRGTWKFCYRAVRAPKRLGNGDKTKTRVLLGFATERQVTNYICKVLKIDGKNR